MSKRKTTALLITAFVCCFGMLCGCAAAPDRGAEEKTVKTENTTSAAQTGKASGLKPGTAQPEPGSIKKPSDEALKKLSTRLLQLADESYLPEGKTQEQLIEEMTDKKIIAEKQTGGGETTLCVHVYIKLASAEGFEPLEAYIAGDYDVYDGALLAAAWLDIRHIAEAAAVTQVKSISEVNLPITRGQ